MKIIFQFKNKINFARLVTSYVNLMCNTCFVRKKTMKLYYQSQENFGAAFRQFRCEKKLRGQYLQVNIILNKMGQSKSTRQLIFGLVEKEKYSTLPKRDNIGYDKSCSRFFITIPAQSSVFAMCNSQTQAFCIAFTLLSLVVIAMISLRYGTFCELNKSSFPCVPQIQLL